MMSRCYNGKHKFYRRYGGRGIFVDINWHDKNAFIADMLPTYKKGLTLDRVDNNKSYSKENCLWRTQKQQMNNIESNRLLTLGNETRNLSEWGEITGLGKDVIYHRLALGWSVEDSLTLSKFSTRSERIIIKYNGMSFGFKGWSEITGIPKSAIYDRYNRGWDVERMLTTPYTSKKNA